MPGSRPSSQGRARRSASTRRGARALPGVGESLRHPGAYFRQLMRNLRHNFSTRPGSTVLLLLPAVLILAAYGYVLAQVFLAPSVEGLADRDLARATVLYTADGQDLSRLYEENRTWVPLDSIAPVVPEALVAIEDQRFYQHAGVSFRRTAGALLQTARGNKQGGSTITMQLARNAFTDVANDWIITRKIKEWITAVRISDRYSKDEVLEIYLNTVPLSYNTFGVEAASQVYFNKPAYRMDTLQAATLMAMLRGPTLYNPVRNPENNRTRRNRVLDAMTETGTLSEAQAHRLQQQETPMDFQPVSVSHNRAPYFAEYVRQKLETWAEENGYDIYRDGLKVYTTLDAKLQEAAAQAVESVLSDLQAVVDVSWSSASTPYFSSNAAAYQRQQNPQAAFSYFWQAHPTLLNSAIKRSARYKRLAGQDASEDAALDRLRSDAAFLDSVKTAMQRLQAGFVAMDPNDGHIKAWVGGRNFEEDQYDHVAQAERQPGSTFKPFVYATALDRGYRQNDVLIDEKIRYVNDQTGQTWSPGNFGGESGKMMTLKEGLANSKNTITAQLVVDVGPERVADMAHRMGIESKLKAVPSLGLGTSEVNLLEMAGAYGTLANNGRHQEPVAITRIEDRSGRTVADFRSESRQALPPATSYGTLSMMKAVVTEGTGVRINNYIESGGQWAAKTGTTTNNADGWFMLIHPGLVMGSWVGFNSPQVTFRTRYWGQGAHNALLVTGHFLQNAGLPAAQFSAPRGYEPPSEGQPRHNPEALFARQDVSLANDSLSFGSDSLGTGDDPYDFGFSEDDTTSLFTSDEETGPGEGASRPSEPAPTDDIEGQSAADSLNRQQGIEARGGGN